MKINSKRRKEMGNRVNIRNLEKEIKGLRKKDMRLLKILLKKRNGLIKRGEES